MLPIGRVSFKARAIAPLRPPPRTHLSLEKDSPASRSVQPPSIGSVVALSKAHFRSSGRTPLNAGVCVTLPLFVAMSVVLPTEGDRLAIEGEEPVIGNGHSMGVSGQVLQQVIGTAEGCFGVDDPLFLAHWFHEGEEPVPAGEIGEFAGEDEFSGAE